MKEEQKNGERERQGDRERATKKRVNEEDGERRALLNERERVQN
jgi:hypothetical protein